MQKSLVHNKFTINYLTPIIMFKSEKYTVESEVSDTGFVICALKEDGTVELSVSATLNMRTEEAQIYFRKELKRTMDEFGCTPLA